MIHKIEFLENNQNHNNLNITIDFLEEKLQYIKEGIIVKDISFTRMNEIIELLKKYILYWDNEYINNVVIDGIESQLMITTNEEVIKYIFKNKCPMNYYEFLEQFKMIVGVL